MNIIWNINQTDIQNVRDVIKNNNNAFVKSRKNRNVEKQNIVITKDSIVKSMLMCLLTSQQRSGPNSVVGTFLGQKPFPFTADKIVSDIDLEKLIKQTLQQNGLKRYINRISGFFAENINKICSDNWTIIEKLEGLRENHSKEAERELADYLNDWLKGFGPKQSRNFLQSLGLTKFEIPIDSRITNWLNDKGFPVTLSSTPLGDKGYYHFVSDGIQRLCEKAEVYPCILDAAIFSSFDNGEWSEDNSIF